MCAAPNMVFRHVSNVATVSSFVMLPRLIHPSAEVLSMPSSACANDGMSEARRCSCKVFAASSRLLMCLSMKICAGILHDQRKGLPAAEKNIPPRPSLQVSWAPNQLGG